MRWKKWKGGTQRMAKYKALVEEFKEKEAHRAAQKELKEKHKIEDENVVVVEKSNMAKFSVNTFIRFIKFIVTVIILCLAAIGLTALIFPETREALLAIFHLAAEQTTEMIGS